MKLILLSGGSGKRLWPLSNDNRSKQFLKMLQDDKNELQSMVQRVWGQINKVGLAESTLIATSKMQRDMIHSQVGANVPIVVEPERRDTFPAIALASAYLYSEESVDENETVMVLPVDPYVEDHFFDSVREVEKALLHTGADLGLMGVQPTYPSTKYGYIVPNEILENGKWLDVAHFAEKPAEEKAEELLAQKAIWNSGVFGFRLGYLLNILRDKGWSLDYTRLSESYSDLPKISFDYEVVEKAKKIVAVPYEGYWKDLGTWNTLTEEMGTASIGKGTLCDDNINTHLINELDIPVTVIGTENLVVAASPDGILVADKASSHKIKEIVADYDQKPMYEERIWGWSRVLDYAKYEDGQEMVTKRIHIKAGANSSFHFHRLRDEVWTIVRGEGELALDDHVTRVKAGDIIHLPAGKKHGIKAFKDLEFIEVQTGQGISDEDFERIYFEWDDVLREFLQAKAKFIY
ncbi:sugar phosphate nucleotidyltransferase [Jeotgalibacillus proteolyticus]|uniref:Mannose-1-phosphate guanylyltransferase n=1 Tax=Jeotgalibacillus proteolyticus TaxID=2082395 RepID=A0A2S5G983_9BACL|nr:sugar phosphate nucleotidyltransferase [Jeotgalibacillus proteolyticus]PPA69495.1 mannose-1-phosphate guanylyltransferase [Jeotgalibacillus proteolyticus]